MYWGIFVLLLWTVNKAQAIRYERGDSNSRPNVVFVLADDWGWGDVRVYNPSKKYLLLVRFRSFSTIAFTHEWATLLA